MVLFVCICDAIEYVHRIYGPQTMSKLHILLPPNITKLNDDFLRVEPVDWNWVNLDENKEFDGSA